MHERTGQQTAIGMINIAFGMMGLVLSALFFALGPRLEASLGAGGASPGLFVTRMPTSTAVSAALEVAMLVTWLIVIWAGAGALRQSQWAQRASLLAGGALLVVSSAKVVDSGPGFITLGFVAYGALVLTVATRLNWSTARTARAIEREEARSVQRAA